MADTPLSGLTALQSTQLATTDLVYIEQLSTTQSKKITVGDFIGASVNLLTSTQIQELTTTQLAALTTTQVGAILTNATTTQVAGLTSTNISALIATSDMSTTQMASMNATSVGALSTGFIDTLIDTQIGRLTTTQIANLTTTQLGGLTTTQQRALGIQFVQNGWLSADNMTLSFDDGTRTLTISDSGGTLQFWSGGVLYSKSSPQTIQIANTTGTHHVYFDTNGAIQETTSFTQSLLTTWAYTAAIYWNVTYAGAINVGNELHGAEMDGRTHSYLHATHGTQFDNGLAITPTVVGGNGSLDTHAQIAVAAGQIRDEDISVVLAANNAPATIPVLYKSGASGDWYLATTTDHCVKTFGTGRLAWNEWTGATWQLTEVTNAQFVLYHIVATNCVVNPIKAIMGQNQYTTLVAARTGAETEIGSINTSGLPYTEWRVIGTLIYRTSDVYANAVKASIQSTADGDSYVDWRTNEIQRGATSNDHNSLGGLEGGTAGEYYHLTEAQHATATQLATTFTTTQVASLQTTGVSSLTSTVMATLTTAGVGAITTTAMTALITRHISELTTTQIAGFTTTQIAGFTTTQFAAITSTQIGAITSTAGAALQGVTAATGPLTTTQLAGLTTTQLAILTSTQIAAITPILLSPTSGGSVGSLLAKASSGNSWTLSTATEVDYTFSMPTSWSGSDNTWTSGSITITSSHYYSTYTLNKAFDGTPTSGADWWSIGAGTAMPYSWKVDFGSGNSEVINMLSITTLTPVDYAPAAWTFEGSNNDTDWTTLDTRSGETSWTANVTRDFDVANATGYRYYRQTITANVVAGTGLQIYGIEFNKGTHEKISVDGSVVIGNPTGGDKGVGTANGKAFYDDGAILTTCYPLQLFNSGVINDADWYPSKMVLPAHDAVVDPNTGDVIFPAAEERVIFGGNPGLDKFKAKLGTIDDPMRMETFFWHMKRKGHLTAMPNAEKQTETNRPSIGGWIGRGMETLDILAIHMFKMYCRIRTLEAAATKPYPEDGLYRKWDSSAGDWVVEPFMPSPYPSWVLNQETGEYDPPVAMPEEGGPYSWDEDQLNWVAQ